jgi:Holliday junction resolvase
VRSEGQRRSLKQERRTAKLYNGRRTPGSGNGWARKGDVVTQSLLIENKYTGNEQITIKRVALKKICDEATAEGRLPVLGVELSGEHYVILPEADFLEVLGDAGRAGVDP